MDGLCGGEQLKLQLVALRVAGAYCRGLPCAAAVSRLQRPALHRHCHHFSAPHSTSSPCTSPGFLSAVYTFTCVF